MPNSLQQSISVYPGEALFVSAGANLGDGMTDMEELVLDDTYQLREGARQMRLALVSTEGGGFCIGDDSEAGTPGAMLHLDCVVTLMSQDGRNIEAIILVEVDEVWMISAIFVMPLAPLTPKTDYALVGFDRRHVHRRFAQTACVSFTRGTRITMATGEQKPVELIRPGDRVLTRDDGPQEVRWIGSTTVRAVGELAPIVIAPGVLNNENELVVSPEHRLFVYQRSDRLGVGRPEILVKARHLINDDTVRVREGGFLEYFQILFDRHHIIYAEGIAAESTLIDSRTRPLLPPELIDRLGALLPEHGRAEHGLDVQRAILERPDAIDLLRQASSG